MLRMAALAVEGSEQRRRWPRSSTGRRAAAGIDRLPGSRSTASVASGGWRSAGGVGLAELDFVHVNEIAGDAARCATCSSSTPSTAAGPAPVEARGRRPRDRRRGTRLSARRRARGEVAWAARASTSSSSAPASSARSTRSRPTSSRACARSSSPRRSRTRARSTSWSASTTTRRARPPRHPHRRLLHDQLPGAGGEGDPRGDRHPARRRSRPSTT